MALQRLYCQEVIKYGNLSEVYFKHSDIFTRVPNVYMLINSIILRWAGHVARMEKGRSGFKQVNLQERPIGGPMPLLGLVISIYESWELSHGNYFFPSHLK